MTLRKNRVAISLEAIRYQAASSLFLKLTELFDQMLERTARVRLTEQLFKEFDIAKVVRDETNLRTVQYLEKDVLNAFVYPPDIDRNNPIVNDWMKGYMQNTDALTMIKNARGAIKGRVNRAESKVYGCFEELEISIHLGDLFFNGKKRKYSGEQIAAILLHELGHVFSYLEALGEMVSMNGILSAICREVTSGVSEERKLALLTETERVLDINIDRKAELAKLNDADGYQVVILEARVRESRSALGSDVYDYRWWESASDQFATRHGAGKALATGLDTLMRDMGSSSYWSGPRFWFTEAFKWLVVAPFLFSFATIPYLVILFSWCPLYNDYDNPGERIARIRREMQGELKSPAITPVRRKKILEDLDVVANLEKDINDRKTLFYRLWTVFNGRMRAQDRQIAIQQTLEELANNDLFVSAARIKDLTK